MADNYIQRRAKAYAKRAQTAWEAYQSSGERRYDREYTEFSMIADALRKAADNEDHMQKYFNAEQRLDKAVAQVKEMLQSPAPDYEQCTAILLQTIVAVRFWG
ncbi:MAG: YlbF family regulator [Lentihominibacter sp.]|uniref:YlbF family regulator n=1 Tax=Lentihominibacter sp. TaxID=2944216 RepID=UPI002A912A95|nr:YlbF family regulator [Lentihominibacter sp.]MDY5287625.1 YlbF family regulator [Lentihominibacter sp.]